eukprot:CAMPEP_0201583220 /NCGR_PEP_ID=MMETSP0190_2-20130828/95918_1 /ASSEMBLY_ACC=CAM_ASM_000263 /TAXON_ID=37353 /ORGANISM="Rosalina sp." /LENGTH=172 /DNA_ID=CAMNT_0048024711 /DNA_START=69 /DNA_END=584 /DNA_ORIENTATION=-
MMYMNATDTSNASTDHHDFKSHESMKQLSIELPKLPRVSTKRITMSTTIPPGQPGLRGHETTQSIVAIPEGAERDQDINGDDDNCHNDEEKEESIHEHIEGYDYDETGLADNADDQTSVENKANENENEEEKDEVLKDVARSTSINPNMAAKLGDHSGSESDGMYKVERDNE